MSGSKEAFRERLAQLGKIYIDGVEQSIRRPKNSVEQKSCYSGKKKAHTVKALVVSGPDKKIEGLTDAYVGSSHDFSMFKDEKLGDDLPSKTPVYVDTGFEGIFGEAPQANIRKPKKKKKGRKLNGGEMLGNRMISKERVKVEHSIGGLKKFRIASDKFRGINFSNTEVFKVTSGLWNLQVEKRSTTHGARV